MDLWNTEDSEYGTYIRKMMGMKLETLISHLRASSELGVPFIININYIQLLSGIGEPIFQSKDDITYVPMNWILHLRQFLIEINASLEIRNLWLPQPQRMNDQFLMTAFWNKKATRAELVVHNNWRIY
jgi:hypothetical protein